MGHFYTGELFEPKTNLLRSYHEEGALSFEYIYMQFCFSFLLLTSECAHLSPLHYLLDYICKCEASAHRFMCCFYHAPCPQYAAIHVLQLCSKLKGRSYWLFKGPADLIPCIVCVSMHAQKAYIFELWLFKKWKGGIGTNNYSNIKFFSEWKKKQSGNQLINWNGLTVPLIFTSCTNSGVLSSTVLDGMKLEILEPLSWLMLWEWTRAWKH